MAKKIDYAAWKKALWEAWRVFIPAFLAVIYAQLEAGVDVWGVKTWGFTLLFSAGLPGSKALVKWARETYGNKKYDSWLYRIPA